MAKEVAAIQGLSKVLVVENKDYTGFMPERLTPLLLAAQDQFKFSHIVAGASAFSRGLLPRVAAKVYSELHLMIYSFSTLLVNFRELMNLRLIIFF